MSVMVTTSNILSNPGFEEGETGWAFVTDGKGAFTTVTQAHQGSRAAQVTLEKAGSHTQLFQTNFLLKAATRYQLTLAACSTSGANLALHIHKDSAPNTNFGLKGHGLELAKEWQEYHIEFTTTGFEGTTNDTRLRLSFPATAKPGSVFLIDDLSLSEAELTELTGPVEVHSGWPLDWLFLRQERDKEGGGGFHISNPWGDSDQPQGDPARNRLEIAYKKADGEDLWGQFVLHGPSGRVGIGTTEPTEKLHVQGNVKVAEGQVEVHSGWPLDWLFLRQERDKEGGGGFHISNPWGDSDQPQGDPARNRLEIAYKKADGEDLWGQFVLHGPSGRVGIGTTEPTEKLHVRGTIKVDDGINYGLIGNDRPPEGTNSFVVRSYGLPRANPIKLQQQVGPHSFDRVTVDATGKVGIGTTTPAVQLDVAGDELIQGAKGFNAQGEEAALYLGDGSHYIKAKYGTGVQIGTWHAPEAITLQQETAKVGIGTTAPAEKLHVLGHGLVQGPDAFKEGGEDARLYLGDQRHFIGAKRKVGVRIGTWKQENALIIQQETGNVWIGMASPPELSAASFSQAKLHVNGNIEVEGDIRFPMPKADCAEEFDVIAPETVEPGTVMVLGQDDALQPCAGAYDRKVVGVVSGAGHYEPAFVLDRHANQPNRLPVALIGKVYCKADARYGPIAVGDLLTTSPTMGHAMKATDPTQAFGAIVGKALGALDTGSGLIPILATLQ